MQRNFKPYSKRKPFKRKSGGAKFLLKGKAKFDFPANQQIKDPPEGFMNLIASILGQRKQHR